MKQSKPKTIFALGALKVIYLNGDYTVMNGGKRLVDFSGRGAKDRAINWVCKNS